MTSFEKAKEIIKTYNEQGYGAYLVDGCVKDMLFNEIFDKHNQIKDYDMATNCQLEI